MFRKRGQHGTPNRRISRTFRVYRRAYHEIQQAAIDDGMSVNALILRAVEIQVRVAAAALERLLGER